MKTDWAQEAAILFQMYGVNKTINTSFDACISISQSRFEILSLIYQEFEISQGDLQRKVTIDKSAVTRHIKQLEENEIILRRRKEDDNRIILVRLTEQGRHLIENAQREKESFARALLADIGEEELVAFRAVLSKLNKNVKEIKASECRQ
ncbi:MarR family winged helix-turn-helix transcriptional regulator [Paenibacillus sp. Leaf72]|uniref:MarR family winged helix-turn-helix transcriptional regulator n=1 Tax=Paenibacillus sp. Leaf72 TaxID=1736234 RepID=UPI0006F8B140|nr:MarR family transcriptional regulator [Paenibacillus sp. Leaf72]KQN97716.1 MarR family transcriptional regulator [Paenibacillus sp. Leaf72]